MAQSNKENLLCLLRTSAAAFKVKHCLPSKTGSEIQQNNYLHMHREKNMAVEEYTN